MKKNKAMRAAGVLVIATLLTTCLTAGTFAKYTTTDSATDSARVAKFGVTVVANGSLYGSAYAANHADTPVVADNTVTVKASNGDNVVAPGTKNDSGIGFAVNGKPEVDVKITGTVEAEDIFLKPAHSRYQIQKNTLCRICDLRTKFYAGASCHFRSNFLGLCSGFRLNRSPRCRQHGFSFSM